LIVVADTSPVLSLARISRPDFLRVLYQQVLIPSAVYRELRASSSQPPGHIDFDAVPWLIVVTAMDRRRVEALREDWIWVRPKRLCLRWNAGLTCCSSTNDAGDGRPMPQARPSLVFLAWWRRPSVQD
jgi:hypothetical protein